MIALVLTLFFLFCTSDNIGLPFYGDNINLKCNVDPKFDLTIVYLNNVFAARYSRSSQSTGSSGTTQFQNKDLNPLLLVNLAQDNTSELTCTVKDDSGFGQTVEENSFKLMKATEPKFLQSSPVTYGVILTDQGENLKFDCQVENELNGLITELTLTKVSTGKILAMKTVENEDQPMLAYQSQNSPMESDLGTYKCSARRYLSEKAKEFYGAEYLKNIEKTLDSLKSELIIDVVEHFKPRILISQKKVYTTFNENVVLNAEVIGEPFPQVVCNSTKTAFEKFNIPETKRVIRESVRNVRQIRDKKMQINLGMVFNDKTMDSANDQPVGYSSLKTKKNAFSKTVKYYCRAVNEYGEDVSDQIEITIIPKKLEIISPPESKYSDFYDLRVSVVSGESIKLLKGSIYNKLTREQRSIEAEPVPLKESQTLEGKSFQYRHLIPNLDQDTEYKIDIDGCTGHACSNVKTEFTFKTDKKNEDNNFATFMRQVQYNNSASGRFDQFNMITFTLSVLLVAQELIRYH